MKYAITVFHGIDFDGEECQLTDKIKLIKIQSSFVEIIDYIAKSKQNNSNTISLLQYEVNDDFTDNFLPYDNLKDKIRFDIVDPLYTFFRLFSNNPFSYSWDMEVVDQNYNFNIIKIQADTFIPHMVDRTSKFTIDTKFIALFNDLFPKYISLYNGYKNVLSYFTHSILDADADFSKVFLCIALECLLLRESRENISSKFTNRLLYIYNNYELKNPFDDDIEKLESLYKDVRCLKLHNASCENTDVIETLKYQQIFRDVMLLILSKNISLDNDSAFLNLVGEINEKNTEFKITIPRNLYDNIIQKTSFKNYAEVKDYISHTINNNLDKLIDEK